MSIHHSLWFGLLACTLALPEGASSLSPQDPSAPSANSVSTLAARESTLKQQEQQLRANHVAETDPALKQVQADLLDVTGQEDAAIQRLPENAKGASTSYVSIPVLFVTDRAKNGSAFADSVNATGLSYGMASTNLGLSYGVRVDAIPGAKNLPQSAPLASPTTQPLKDLDALLAAIMATRTDATGRKRKIVLFVHGYNVSFPEAMTAAAKLATVLQFPVIPIAYSWPSSGTLRGYWHDEDTIRASSMGFMDFLKNFVNRSPLDVVLICHSMGAREVTAALAEMGRGDTQLPALKQVIFAAGDVSQQEFIEAWPSLLRLKGVEYGFYVSDHDLALRLSHVVHSLPRLGDAAPAVLAPPGGMTIDASAIDSVFQSLGHSYVLDSPKVGADIGEWIDGGQAPRARGLIPIGAPAKTYYVFP